MSYSKNLFPFDHFLFVHSLQSVTMPPSPPPKPNQKFLFFILKAVVMIVITMLFFLFLGVAAILLLIPTAALHRHSTPSSNSPKGLRLKDLKKLSRFRFSTKSRSETGAGQSSCVVCLEDIKEGEWCRNLIGCGHVFHRKCVDSWLVKVSACPICRNRVELDQGVKDRPSWEFVSKNELSIGRVFSFL